MGIDQAGLLAKGLTHVSGFGVGNSGQLLPVDNREVEVDSPVTR